MTDKEALEIVDCECDKETSQFISQRLKLLEEIEENPFLAIQLKQQKFEHLRNRKM